MHKITLKKAREVAKRFKINLKVVPIDVWRYGLEVELEHGTKLGKITNVTNNNLDLTAQIAIAHLIEGPDYYQRLMKMEKGMDKRWSGKEKPNIFVE